MKSMTYKGFQIRCIKGSDVDPQYNYVILNNINEIINHARTLEFAKIRITRFHAKRRSNA